MGRMGSGNWRIGPRRAPAQRPVMANSGQTATGATGASQTATGATRAGATGADPVIAVPSEALLILALTLPPLAASQRRAAALFAAEPFLSQPLEEMQLILGPRLGPDAAAPYLAVVLARSTLRQILAQHPASRARLVPDVLLLPRPPEGHWTVAAAAGRLLARLPDGTGFAAAEPAFRAIWAQSGGGQTGADQTGPNQTGPNQSGPDQTGADQSGPDQTGPAQSGPAAILWHHGTPPAGLPLATAPADFDPNPDPSLASFDLAEGRLPRWRQPRHLAALAVVVLVGLCGHLGLLALDAHRLHISADLAEARLRQALDARGIAVGSGAVGSGAGGSGAGGPAVEASAMAVLRGDTTGAAPEFLALLSRALQAMAPQSGQVSLQDLAFDRASGVLTVTLVAPDLSRLQDAAALLVKAGMQADLGTSTQSQGQARASLVIKGPTFKDPAG